MVDTCDLIGQPWDVWLERTAPCSSDVPAAAVDEATVATLPHLKAPCYGSCPAYDTFVLVKCADCASLLKPVAFGSHRSEAAHEPSVHASAPFAGDHEAAAAVAAERSMWQPAATAARSRDEERLRAGKTASPEEAAQAPYDFDAVLLSPPCVAAATPSTSAMADAPHWAPPVAAPSKRRQRNDARRPKKAPSSSAAVRPPRHKPKAENTCAAVIGNESRATATDRRYVTSSGDGLKLTIKKAAVSQRGGNIARVHQRQGSAASSSTSEDYSKYSRRKQSLLVSPDDKHDVRLLPSASSPYEPEYIALGQQRQRRPQRLDFDSFPLPRDSSAPTPSALDSYSFSSGAKTSVGHSSFRSPGVSVETQPLLPPPPVTPAQLDSTDERHPKPTSVCGYGARLFGGDPSSCEAPPPPRVVVFNRRYDNFRQAVERVFVDTSLPSRSSSLSDAASWWPNGAVPPLAARRLSADELVQSSEQSMAGESPSLRRLLSQPGFAPAGHARPASRSGGAAANAKVLRVSSRRANARRPSPSGSLPTTAHMLVSTVHGQPSRAFASTTSVAGTPHNYAKTPDVVAASPSSADLRLAPTPPLGITSALTWPGDDDVLQMARQQHASLMTDHASLSCGGPTKSANKRKRQSNGRVPAGKQSKFARSIGGQLTPLNLDAPSDGSAWRAPPVRRAQHQAIATLPPGTTLVAVRPPTDGSGVSCDLSNAKIVSINGQIGGNGATTFILPTSKNGVVVRGIRTLKSVGGAVVGQQPLFVTASEAAVDGVAAVLPAASLSPARSLAPQPLPSFV